MTEITEVLVEEHRAILRGLACLERLAETAEREATLDRTAAGDALRFIREFADQRHHAKEEDELFPRLHVRGMPREQGPVAVMLLEHEEGRSRVRAMLTALEEEDTAAFAANARAFVGLLRDHIAKEDGVLFPLADRMLAGEGPALLKAYRQADARVGGDLARKELLELLSSLELRCGLAPESAVEA